MKNCFNLQQHFFLKSVTNCLSIGCQNFWYFQTHLSYNADVTETCVYCLGYQRYLHSQFFRLWNEETTIFASKFLLI